MASHRMNSNYISEADRLKKQVFLITSETMGLGNFIGALLFALYIIFDKKEISLYEYPIPFAMLFLSLFSLWLKKTQMKEKLQNYLYSINYITIPLIVFYFVDDAAVTIWAIVFLYLIPAFILQNGILISYAFGASLLTLVCVMVFSPPLAFVQVGIADHLMRIAFLVIAAVFAWIGLNSNKKKAEMLFHYMNQAEEMAFQDSLLKIPNRIDFNMYVDHALQKGPLVLWKVEIHHFQSVYDVMGHQKSDKLLAMVKHRLREQLDSSSYLAKGEGSTFLVAETSWTDKDKTGSHFDGILKSLAEPYKLEYHDYLLSFNIGAACSLQDGSTSDELMRHAQFAVDKAKELGLNRAVFCSDAIKQNTM
jgi:diguanylate cyclase (GGDEF)-like protein